MNTLKTVAVLTACLLASICAQSQVVIYKNKVTLTHTGGGATTKLKIAGYTVLNATNGAVTRLEAYPSTKNFREVQVSYSVNVVRAAKGKDYTVLAMVDSLTDQNGNLFQDSETLKGLNVVTDIGAVPGILDWSIPKTMQLVGKTIYTLSGQPTIDEATGTLSYDKSNTTQVNMLKLSLSEVVSALKKVLQDDGYHSQ